MSYVTSVVILASCGEDLDTYPDLEQRPALAHVNGWLKSEGYGRGLTSLDDHAGGDKNIQADLYAGAFNKLDVAGFRRALASAPWEDPEDVQVLIKEEEDFTFTLYRLDEL